MSTLSSASTLQQIKDAYADNASYEEDASVAKAKIFITACRLLLVKLPKRAVHGGRGGEEVELEPDLIRDELASAQKWLAVQPDTSGSGTVTHVSFENFRS